MDSRLVFLRPLGLRLRVEICSNCHPFFTGRQKLIDTEGRVDRFQKKYKRGKLNIGGQANTPAEQPTA